MNSEIVVRMADVSDLEALVHLAIAFRDHLGQTAPTEGNLRASIDILLRDGTTDFVLAQDGAGVVLGYVQVRYRFSAWVSGLQAELEDVFIIPAARRCGMGRRLLEFAFARAGEKGCRSVGLNTNERNAPALALYHRMGFSGERPRWNGARQLWLDRSLPSR